MARYVFTTSFEKRLINVCRDADSMAKAAVILGMNYKTLCFHAKKLGCFKPNQSGKGLSKEPSKIPIAIARIFDGTHTTYQSHKLKKKLLKEGYKQAKCELCDLSEWMVGKFPWNCITGMESILTTLWTTLSCCVLIVMH